MTFEELKFEPDPHHYAGIMAKVFFPNGYGASVVRNRMTYGGDVGLYELAVLIGTSEHFDLCYTSPITDDVVGHLPPAAVTGLLKEIEELPPVGGTESRGEPPTVNVEMSYKKLQSIRLELGLDEAPTEDRSFRIPLVLSRTLYNTVYQAGWNDRAVIDDKMVSKAIEAFGDIVLDDDGSVQGWRLRTPAGSLSPCFSMSVAMRAALEAALGVNCKEGNTP